MRTTRFLSSLILMAIGLCANGILYAQAFRGTILGRITDPGGAVVPGATVEVLNLDTNATQSGKTNEDGNYQVPFLLPGNYSVRVEHPGFKRLEQNNVRVPTNAQVTLDFQLELGAASDKVTVTAEAPLLNMVNGDLGQVISNVYVSSTTVSGVSRNVMADVVLTPAITGDNDVTYTGNGSTAFTFNGGGGRRGANEYLIDGIPNTVLGGGIAWVPPLDMIEEVKVHTTMFDAADGHSNGGAVNIATKSGTNELHGTGYYYKRWADLIANGWTNNRLGNPRPPDYYYQWGYVVTGPVYLPHIYNGRNKTFFSTSLERDHDPRALNPISRVPTDLERKGDFSQTLSRIGGPLAIYDPQSTAVNGNTATRQVFAGARIPADRLSATGLAILNSFPLPNQPSVRPQINGAPNWSISKHYYVAQRQAAGRLDHIFSERQRVFTRFSYLSRASDSDDIGVPALLATNVGHSLIRFMNVSGDDTFTFSPTLVGSVRLGVLRVDTKSRSGGADLDTSSLQLADSLAKNQFFQGYPNFTLGEGFATNIGSGKSFVARNTYTALASMTKLTGKHSTKFGIDYRLNRWNNVAPGASAFGSFSFDSTFTRADPFTNTSSDTSGTAMASLLLGLPASGTLGYVSPLSLQSHYLGAFVQNDWKVTPKLTLNLGVRWELDTPFTERYNRMSYGFDQNAKLPVQAPGLDLRGGILFAGVNGSPRSGGQLDTNNFGPRFGFAYNVLPKTVIRGGYGIFYSVESNLTSFNGAIGAFDTATPFAGSTDNGATPFRTLANPFPTGLQQPAGSSLGLLAQAGSSVSFFDSRRVTPYAQQWQFSIQRELPSQVVVEAAYVGMHNLKEPESFNLNEKPDQFLPLGAAENTRVTNPFLGVLPATSTLGQGATITQGQLWVQYPQFTGVTIQGVPTGAASYNSLQAKAEKRMTHGFSLMLAYTFSKLMTNNTTSLINPRHYRSIGSIDQTHVFRPTFAYQLPIHLEHANRVLKSAFGSWQLSGFATLTSGLPMSVTQANGRPIRLRDPALSGSVGDRLGDRRDPATGRVLNPYFDITAFQPLPSQYTISPEPPYLAELRAPGEKTLSLYLFKDFRVTERMKARLHVQAYNVLNSIVFDPPGTNMSNQGTFGVILTTHGPNNGGRVMQFGFRFEY
jgi:hypothetical protein